MPLGQDLINHAITDQAQLEKALALQLTSGGKIGEILFAMTDSRAIDYYRVIAKHFQIDFVDLVQDKIDFSLLNKTNKEKYFTDMTIPIACVAGNYTVATALPSLERFDQIKQEYGETTIIVCTSKFDILWTLQKQFNPDYLQSSIHELADKSKRLSAKYPGPLWLKLFYSIPLCGLFILFFTNIKLALLIVNCIILVTSSLMIGFKILLSVIGLFIIKRKQPVENLLSDDELPIYSVLVPLYKENQVTLTNLFFHLKKINYPSHKLDIKILLEEDDVDTITILKNMHLPSYIEFIYVPASEPRTKAKACNYGFKFARGKYLCLYDAEDQPDPDQIRQAVQIFKQNEDANVACVQCKLNFYNSNENWLTRMFTIEYTYWFDLLLPALAVTRIPIPLGGTSNHFRTDLLRDVFAWDPFNVTEDADLGLRLSRLGYTTKILDSTTYEEATCQFMNWIKQRSRWVKGYMQTYAVHMRNPFELWHKIGTKGFFGFQLFIGGTILSNLTNIPMWLMSLVLLLFPQIDVSYYFPGKIYTLALCNLYIGTVGIVLLNVLGVITRKRADLAFSALTSPVYWWLMSFASYRALYQLIFKPSYWEKTAHGVSKVFKK